MLLVVYPKMRNWKYNLHEYSTTPYCILKWGIERSEGLLGYDFINKQSILKWGIESLRISALSQSKSLLYPKMRNWKTDQIIIVPPGWSFRYPKMRNWKTRYLWIELHRIKHEYPKMRNWKTRYLWIELHRIKHEYPKMRNWKSISCIILSFFRSYVS